MNQLVFIQDNQVITDSLTIAGMFGKGHDNVLRDIRKQIEFAGEEFSLLNFEESNYESRGKQYPKFNLTEEAFALVVFSYNTKEAVQTKIKFIQEFKRMKEYIQKQEQQGQDPVELALQASLKNYQEIKTIKGEVIEVKETVQTLVDTMRIDGNQEAQIRKRANEAVMEAVGGKDANAYKQLSKQVFSAFWRDFKNHFQIPRYGDLPRSRFAEGIKFISMWQPNTSLRMDITTCNGQGQLKLVQ